MAAGAAALAAVGAALIGLAPAGAVPRAYLGSDGRIAYVHEGSIFSVEFRPTPPYAFGRKRLTRAGHGATRLSDPDWNAVSPISRSPFFEVNLLTTVRDCSTSPCSAGLSLTIGGAVQQIPGTAAYEGVFAPSATPDAGYIAYVQNLATGGSEISVAQIPFILNDWRPIPLTAGTEPDWQPTAPFPG